MDLISNCLSLDSGKADAQYLSRLVSGIAPGKGATVVQPLSRSSEEKSRPGGALASKAALIFSRRIPPLHTSVGHARGSRGGARSQSRVGPTELNVVEEKLSARS